MKVILDIGLTSDNSEVIEKYSKKVREFEQSLQDDPTNTELISVGSMSYSEDEYLKLNS